MLKRFISQLKASPESIMFADTMAVIDATYLFMPSQFQNGDVFNDVGQNSGSCKIFSFAMLLQLSEANTLACFGEYYREDVLKKPNGDDHANIRSFIKHGCAGLSFPENALVLAER